MAAFGNYINEMSNIWIDQNYFVKLLKICYNVENIQNYWYLKHHFRYPFIAILLCIHIYIWAPQVHGGKESVVNAGDTGLIPGKIPWHRKWQPTPVFLPGKLDEQGDRRATVCGATKSWTQLSTAQHMYTLHYIHKLHTWYTYKYAKYTWLCLSEHRSKFSKEENFVCTCLNHKHSHFIKSDKSKFKEPSTSPFKLVK